MQSILGSCSEVLNFKTKKGKAYPMFKRIKQAFHRKKDATKVNMQEDNKMYANANDLINSAQSPFNIIEEYAALSPKRKVLLCDTLFVETRTDFQNMVRLLWPEAVAKDMKKLEKFLFLIRKSSR